MKISKKYWGLLSYGLAYIFFVAAYIFSLTNHWLKSNYCFIVGVLIIGVGTLFCSVYKKVDRYKNQFFYLFLVGSLLWDSAVYRLGILNSSLGIGGVLTITTIINAVFIYWLYTNLKDRTFRPVVFVKQNLGLISILIVFWILNLETFSWWFKSDSYTYYADIVAHAMQWDLSFNTISAFSLGGHSCFGYSFFVYIGQYLFPYEGIGIRVVNYLLFTITIYMFYRILCFIFSKTNKTTIVLATAIFAFSPMTFGIMYEINTDFSSLCFFIWVVYFHICKQNVLTFICSLLLCFSKETGILLLFSYGLGCYIFRFISMRKQSLLKKIFCSLECNEWVLLFNPILFFLNWKLSNYGWASIADETISAANSDRSISLRLDYFLVKLKEIFIMNFNWILLPIIGISLLLLGWRFIVKKEKLIKLDIKDITIGILSASVIYWLFNSVYFTFPHYRYVQFFVIFYIILLIFLINIIFQGKNVLKNCCLSIILVLFMIESYVTIDPVSFMTFKNVNTGNGKMISTSTYTIKEPNSIVLYSEEEGVDLSNCLLGDTALYNRQWQGFEDVFEKALGDIKYNDTKIIVFPDIFSNIHYSILVLLGRFDSSTCFWNQESCNMTSNTCDIPLKIVSPSEINEDIFGDKEVWLVKVDYKETYDYSFMENYKIGEVVEYTSGIWRLELIQVLGYN